MSGWLSGFLTVAPCVVAPFPASACGLALALAVDISGSVDSREYGIQMRGLAAGLRDGVVSEALVLEEAMVMVVQWTGTSRQIVSIPWRRITGFEDVEALAAEVEAAPREWRNFSTAIGEALLFTAAQFEGMAHCRRLVMDVSGDGISNEGAEPVDVRDQVGARGIIVNTLVIEGEESGLRQYFRDNVIIGTGAFVVLANGYREYAERMKLKLQLEVAKQLSAAEAKAEAQAEAKSGEQKL